LNIINQIIASLLDSFYQAAGDYGIAIILLTLSMRFLMMPFSIKQQNSMRKQQLLSSEITKIKETYKNNPKKAQEETTRYLQTHGTGMSGFILLLLQLPIMYSLNSVIRTHLTGTVSTVLLPWISSLSVQDPYFILPVITLLIQLLPQILAYLPCLKKLEFPKSKASIMVYIILMNGIFVVTIPSGLGLYWAVSGIFGLTEQIIYRAIALRQTNKAQPA